MKYIGSKARIAKQIATYINNIAFCEGIENYYEPFCGGCNVALQVNLPNIYCNDINEYLIALYKKVQEGMWDYRFITREERDAIREKYVAYRDGQATDLGGYEKWFMGWVAFACSFRSVFFQGYAGIDEKTGVDYQYNMYKTLKKERKKLVDFHFTSLSYDELEIANSSIIYCDAPYFNTYDYNTGEDFDFNRYYEWLKTKAKNNLVLISEYTMPKGFVEIDKWRITCESRKGKHEIREEKLFAVEGGYLVDKYLTNKDIGGLL